MEENEAIMGLTGLRDCMCFSLNKSFALTGMSFREHPFLYEMRKGKGNGFSSYEMPFMIWRICAINL